MPKPYDATLKELIEAFPEDWLAGLGIPLTGPVEVLSPELSTVTAAADAVLRVGDRIVHVDAESGPDPDLATRMLLYNVLIHRMTKRPVHSVVVLLRPNANPGKMSNEVRYAPFPGGELAFRFDVLRVWEADVEDLLKRGLGFLPLAVLGKPPHGQTRKQALPAVLERVAREAVERAAPDQSARLVIAALILGGMYLTLDELKRAVTRFPAMIQSSAFDLFEEMGAIKQARKALLLVGEPRFGKPTDEQKQKLDAIDDLNRLNRLLARVHKADDWDALLKGR
jgi:hypothetical protein